MTTLLAADDSCRVRGNLLRVVTSGVRVSWAHLIVSGNKFQARGTWFGLGERALLGVVVNRRDLSTAR